MRMRQSQDGTTQLRFVRRLSSSSTDEEVKVRIIKIPNVKDTPQNAQCVHFYDGKLVKIPIQNRTLEEKRLLFSMFRDKISSLPIDQSIIRNMEVIMKEATMPQNFYSLRTISLRMIFLAEIIDIINHEDTDILSIFLEQCMDMNTGGCPSGRTVNVTRFFRH